MALSTFRMACSMDVLTKVSPSLLTAGTATTQGDNTVCNSVHKQSASLKKGKVVQLTQHKKLLKKTYCDATFLVSQKKETQRLKSFNWMFSCLSVQLESGTFVGPGLLQLLRAPLKTMRQRQDGVCPTTTRPIETVYGSPAEGGGLTPCFTAGNTNTHTHSGRQESDRAATESHSCTGPL